MELPPPPPADIIVEKIELDPLVCAAPPAPTVIGKGFAVIVTLLGALG